MTAEEMVKELAKLQKDEADIHRRREEIIEALRNAGKDEWDWMSVSAAASMIGKSVNTVYRLVNSGKLETKYIGSCMNVRKSELEALNDIPA